MYVADYLKASLILNFSIPNLTSFFIERFHYTSSSRTKNDMWLRLSLFLKRHPSITSLIIGRESGIHEDEIRAKLPNLEVLRLSFGFIPCFLGSPHTFPKLRVVSIFSMIWENQLGVHNAMYGTNQIYSELDAVFTHLDTMTSKIHRFHTNRIPINTLTVFVPPTLSSHTLSSYLSSALAGTGTLLPQIRDRFFF
jgi:hypothetical protein